MKNVLFRSLKVIDHNVSDDEKQINCYKCKLNAKYRCPKTNILSCGRHKKKTFVKL